MYVENLRAPSTDLSISDHSTLCERAKIWSDVLGPLQTQRLIHNSSERPRRLGPCRLLARPEHAPVHVRYMRRGTLGFDSQRFQVSASGSLII